MRKLSIDPNNDSVEGWGGLTAGENGDGGTVFVDGGSCFYRTFGV